LFSYSITLIGILLLLHNAAGKSSGEFELVLSCSAARQYGMEIRKSSVEGSRQPSFNCRRYSGVCARSDDTPRAKI